MTKFPLKIVTMSSVPFEGEAERIIVRTVSGNVGILAKHTNYLAPLAIGSAKIVIDGTEKEAACSGGFISVKDGSVTVCAQTFEWAADIDVERAKNAKLKAEERLKKYEKKTGEYLSAENKLKRALIRLSVADRK